MRSEVKDLINEIHQLRTELNQIAKNVESLRIMFKSWSGVDEPISSSTTTSVPNPVSSLTENNDFQSLFENGVKMLKNCSYEDYLKITKGMGVEPPTKETFEVIKRIMREF